jgi:hypothetical protein
MLERTVLWNIDIISLLFAQLGQLGTEGWKMESSDLLV